MLPILASMVSDSGPMAHPDIMLPWRLSDFDGKYKLKVEVTAYFRRFNWRLLFLVGLYSALISTYALTMGRKIAPVASQNELEQACLAVADELSKVSVPGQRLGKIGLCDFEPADAGALGNRGGRQTSLNTLYATLRLDGMLAKRLQSDLMGRLVKEDLVEAKNLELALTALLRRSIHAPQTPGSLSNLKNQDSIYGKAFRIIAESGHNRERRLVGLNIDLGKLKSQLYSSRSPAPEASAVFVQDGRYRAYYDVPVIDGQIVRFYQSADKNVIVSPDDFQLTDDDTVPSAVLLEATFESLETKDAGKIKTKQNACVLIGARPVSPKNSVMMFSFPHGSLASFNSLFEVITFKNWNKPGQWKRTVVGPVPGSGHFISPMSETLADAISGDAIVVALYHWLFSLGPYVNPEALDRMMLERWADKKIVALERKEPALPVVASNSALLRDTGAANFALLNQSDPNGLGQKILQLAFAAGSLSRLFPSSALPLNVDNKGQCGLFGQSTFDHKLIRDFLTDLYRSNLAGVETRSTAAQIIDEVDIAIGKSESDLVLLREELRLIANDIELVRQGKPALRGKYKGALPAMQKKRQQIIDSITTEMTAKKKYDQIRERATIAVGNAQKIVEMTFELCSHMSRFAAQGLNRIDDGIDGYLLSQSVMFVPHQNPITEKEIYSAAAAKGNERLSWTSSRFQVIDSPSGQAKVNGRPIAEVLRMQAQTKCNRAMFVVLNSDALTRSSHNGVCILDRSPFINTGIPHGQLSFYAPDAVRTGDSPQVRWSVLLRDLVAYKDIGGDPVPAMQPRWCLDLDMGEEECPGLACEIQLRTPIPVLDDLPLGSMLQNTTGRETVPLVPPAPPELL